MPSDATSSGKKDDGSSWEHPLEELRAQQRLIRSPNLKDPGYIRQKANNKLWVRERIAALLDPDSFVEVGSITGKPRLNEKGELESFLPANSVTGWGRIRNRKVFITADDFSVRGGHADGGIGMKAPYGETLAMRARVPLIRLLDGSSGGGSVALYLTLGATYIPHLAGLGRSMDALAVVPLVSALLGPVVGLAAAKTAIGHFSVMVKGLSQLFAAGPPVVKQATFEDLTKEALGGWEIHATNGTVDNVATSELDAFKQIAAFLSYLPSSIFELPPATVSPDPTTRREEELIRIIPRRRARSYDIRKLVKLIVDVDGNPYDPSSSFFEIGETWGRPMVTGFARLGGLPVGVITSDCKVNGGAIDALGSQKTTKFLTLCNHFGLPILNLVDQPGFAIGSLAERMATIRHGASAMAAFYHSTSPIYTVIIRRAFGVAGGAFADPNDGAGTRVAWPSGDWGSLPLEGGIEAAYKRQLDAKESPEEREKFMNELLAKFEDVRSPLKTAHKFGVEEIIDPRDTRPLACEWASHAYQHILPQLSASRQAAHGPDVRPSVGRGYKL
ncbi:propionyl-CoA carboxylase [Pholiota conissans]|uniref:Propionyl-CoA carboxylase beta chain, mitochondrial n=1 Tax=Pholiota conissans TaxID=109636 RepID=A0A9P6D0E1_9AGAR|nr:propionyl-CoA carboxylase [Pholiota conissans]